MSLCPRCRQEADPLVSPFCATCANAYAVSPAVAAMVRVAIDDGRLEYRAIIRRLVAARCLDSQRQCHYCGCTVNDVRDHAADCAWLVGINLYLDTVA
jgi:hypothetical protein